MNRQHRPVEAVLGYARLQWPLENFLWGLEQCSDYVTSSSDIRLSNGTKIMAVARLENIGHTFLKKRPPHLPFESYFSIYKNAFLKTFIGKNES